MLNYLKSVKSRIQDTFDETVVFWLGYLIASIATATITFVVAQVVWVGKRLNIEVCREAYTDLIEISRESFDRFLNRIQAVLPDRVRQSFAFEMKCW